MNATTITTERTRRPRVRKGLLVASSNQARVICTKVFETIYTYRPISYAIVRKSVIDLNT